ncbi:MAG TPA: hypothetical protein VJ773_10715 [Gemmatimonadales bacterium]|nr:hypothetical protein [Gemmatimonadales bacterium]
MPRFGKLVVLALLALPAGRAAAQETGTPVFLAPYRAFENHEFGVALSDPGSGWALEGNYRFGWGTHDLGVRAGFAESGDETGLLLGGSFRTRVLTHSRDFPLDGALTAGLGIQSFDNFTAGLIPVGLSLGRRFEAEGSTVSFIPYAHPVLAFAFGDTDEDLVFGLGLGVDVRVAENLDIRVAGALFDYEGISIGVSWVR